MAYKLKLLPDAIADLEEGIDWYIKKDKKTAKRFLDAFIKTTHLLTLNPLRYPKIRKEVRKARLQRPFPYNIFFIVNDDLIIILAVFHDKRDPKVWKHRT